MHSGYFPQMSLPVSQHSFQLLSPGRDFISTIKILTSYFSYLPVILFYNLYLKLKLLKYVIISWTKVFGKGWLIFLLVVTYLLLTVNCFLVYLVILDHEAYQWDPWAIWVKDVSFQKCSAFASARCSRVLTSWGLI